MSEWDKSEWEKAYSNKYKIFVIDNEKVVAVIARGVDDPFWAINAGIKEVAKDHNIKSITSIQEKIEGGSRIAEVILLIEPKIMGLTK